jgi:hypothetical protein
MSHLQLLSTCFAMSYNPAAHLHAPAGLRWHQQYSYCSYRPNPEDQPAYDPRAEFRSYDCVFPLYQAFLTLLAQWAGYWALAVYLNNVLPNEVIIKHNVTSAYG